jgi:hypothetical protein
MNYELQTQRQQNIDEIEYQWCEQMTTLVEENRIQDADALYSEFVVDEVDCQDVEWLFIKY